MIGVPDTGGDRTVTYDSREGTVAPRLEIVYTPVANTPPTVSLANVTGSLSEATDTTGAIKVADIVVSDDGTGTNDLALTGDDSALFEIVGTELRLIAGATLDHETNPTLDVTVQVDDTDIGSTPDDTAVLSVTVTDANDAPVLDNSGSPTLDSIFENQTDSTGTLISDLIASDLADPITDQDGDPEGIAITWVDDSNGTWEYSTDSGGNWDPVGPVSDNSSLLLAAGHHVRFVPDTAFNGTATFDFRAWDLTVGAAATKVDTSVNGSDTAYSASSETATITVAPVDMKVYLSTVDTQVSAGTAGTDSWTRGDVVAIGDPGFALEANGAKDDSAEFSDGTLYNATQGYLNAANTANSDTIGDVRLSAMHYVSEDVTVGSTTTYDLLAGDLLLSVAHSSATFLGSSGPALTVGSGDVFVFRPDAPGDYRSGTFELLFNDPAGGGNLTAIALADRTVDVGTGGGMTTLQAGTLVYSTDNAAKNNIYFYQADDVGLTTTPLSNGTLIVGDTISLGASGPTGNPITGISLIKQTVVADGVTLSEGALLVTLDTTDNAVGGGTPAAGENNDIYALAVSSTEDAGGTAVDATLLLDGSDLGLNTNGEGFSAFTVLIDTTGGTQDPVLNLGAGTPAYTEDQPAGTLIANGANVNDSDSTDFSGGQLRVELITNGTLNDVLGVQHTGSGSGEVGVVGNLVQ